MKKKGGADNVLNRGCGELMVGFIGLIAVVIGVIVGIF